MRKSPNIIVTGTPGVGKTALCEQLAQSTHLKHLSVNKIAEERDCFDGKDEELGSWIVDEDKVCKELCRGSRAIFWFPQI
jgi:adenylate kinase